MPTYEYECRECSYTFEAFQSINDDPLEKCPLCGGKVRRLIGGGSGIIFKGSGFYITDSKKAQSASTGVKRGSAGSGESAAPAPAANAAGAAPSNGGACCPEASGSSEKAG
jgi:putative FmdB family regulatory protein